MGRYDKIKVYSGNAWKQPKRIQVYRNKQWLDLGDNLSANKQHLFIRQGDSFKRATLEQKVTTPNKEIYADAQEFSVLPQNKFNFCPNAIGYPHTTWKFHAVMRKTVEGAHKVFFIGDAGWNSFITGQWQEDGSFRVSLKSAASINKQVDIVTTNKVPINTWVEVLVIVYKNSTNMEVWFNGVCTNGKMIQNFLLSRCINSMGGPGINFAGPFEVQGADQYGSGYGVSFDASTASGASAQHTYIKHTETGGVPVIEWV